MLTSENGIITPEGQAMNLSLDVLRHIFQLSDVDYNTPEEAEESRLHFFRCALVCKQFLNPALDALWDTMDSLVPLVQLLPSVKNIDGAYVLCGPISDDHWAHFDSYAWRVKKLYLREQSESSYVANTTYVQFASLRKSPLLPALRQLYCPKVTNETLFGAFFLLSPTLDNIELEDLQNSNSQIIEPFINSLVSTVPNIHHLALRGDEVTITSLSSLLQLHHLNSLVFTGYISHEQFLHFGALPRLKSLEVDIRGSEMTPLGDRIGFKRLEYLNITGLVSLIRLILESIECEAMEKLMISTSDYPYEAQELAKYRDEWETCFSVMHKRWPRSLSLIGITELADIQKSGEMWPDLFPSLSRWPNLGTFKFDGWDKEASNEIIQQIALGCPQVKELKLNFRSGKHLNIATLPLVVELFPKLVSLHIRLDLNFDSPLPSNGAPPVSSYGLKTLTICGSESRSKVDFRTISRYARYVDRLFPGLSIVLGGIEDKNWAEVMFMIQMYQSIRLDDRAQRRDATML